MEILQSALDLSIRCNTAGQIQKELKRFLGRVVRNLCLSRGYLRIDLPLGSGIRHLELSHGFPETGFTVPDPSGVIPEFSESQSNRAVWGMVGKRFLPSAGHPWGFAVPILENENRLGFFLLFGEPESLTAPPETLLEDLKTTGKVLGSSLHKLCRIENDHWVIGNLETLNSIGQLVVSKRTLKEMTLEIVRQLGTLFETDEINVILFDDRSRELSFLASYFSDPGNQEGQPVRYPLSDGINSYIVRNKVPLLMKKNTEEECRRLGIRHGGKPAKSWLGVPMMMKDRILGVLSIQSYTQENLYDEKSIRMLSTVASLCAAAVENAKLFEELMEREREKEKLYFSLTHDMLAMVNPISGFSRILLTHGNGFTEENLRQIAGNIQTAARKITKFTEDILVYGKLKSGKLTLHQVNTDLWVLMQGALCHSTPEILFRGIRVRLNGREIDITRPETPAGAMVFCDVDQVERVLINCIDNAVKHTRTMLDIRIRKTGRQVSCRIRDDGDGMDSGMAEKVFEEYFQHKRQSRGVGLGLPTVKGIIDLHGGFIGVKTEPGKGFEIGFTLPTAKTKGDTNGS